MIILSNKEEALKEREVNFKKLKPGHLFGLGIKRIFIAVRKINHKTWEVIELNSENRSLIISGEALNYTKLSFDEMVALNLR